MPWLLKSILFGNLILGLAFALCLFQDWLFCSLKMHFQKKKDR